VLGDESAALRDLVCHLLRVGPSGRCFHERAETGGRTEPHEQSSLFDVIDREAVAVKYFGQSAGAVG